MAQVNNNVCQAYHTPFYLKDKLPNNAYYNRHLFFTRENINFYCLLSEYAIKNQNTNSYSDPIALDHVARNIKPSLSKIEWPKILTTQFIMTNVSLHFKQLDQNYLINLKEASAEFKKTSAYSCCSISIVMYQNGLIWGVQLGMNRVGLTSLHPQTGNFECIIPSSEHAYYREFEETRLSELGLSTLTSMEVFQHEFPSLPTRSIGNYFMKCEYQNSKLGNAIRPPVICTPDIWGPLNVEKDGIKHFFIFNDDFYKAFDVLCLQSKGVGPIERLSHFIWQDYQNNNNNENVDIFNDSARRVIENVLNSLTTQQLQNFYYTNKIVDMALILGTFENMHAPFSDKQKSVEKATTEVLGVLIGSKGFDSSIPIQFKFGSYNPVQSIGSPTQKNTTPEKKIEKNAPLKSEKEYNSMEEQPTSLDFNPLSSLPEDNNLFKCYLKFPKDDIIWTYKSYNELLN